ncbi:MAG TPA: hypothetical protein VFN90_10575 [Gemmatimonadales bacterium]|nr:hypothetical protein [Gemmatimonadales bacterium]
MRTTLTMLAAAALVTACGSDEPRAPGCGMSALTVPLGIMESFGRGDGLGRLPTTVPPRATGRFVGGPTVSVLLSRPDSATLIAAADGPVPEGARPGYGVLVTDRGLETLGVLIYDGVPIPGAIRLGSITVGGVELPLLGARVESVTVSNPRCPLFPAPDADAT